MKLPKKYASNIPLMALTAANVLPLFGALFWGWEAFNIVLLYWAENLAVGFYNILKIAFAKVSHPAEHLGKLFLIPFFTVHYGGFTAVHGVFVLAMFVGLEVIRKVPTTLHTPLMSGSNAISGITLIGAVGAAAIDGPLGAVVGTLAVMAATINVVGGYLVTDRMLRMFRRKR